MSSNEFFIRDDDGNMLQVYLIMMSLSSDGYEPTKALVDVNRVTGATLGISDLECDYDDAVASGEYRGRFFDWLMDKHGFKELPYHTHYTADY